MSETVRVDDLTEQPLRADASVHRTQAGALRPNRALAERLAFTHRAATRLFVLANQPRREYTPEEKLLRAIFGEAANAPEGGQLPSVGDAIARDEQLILHPQETVKFSATAMAEVETVERSTDNLPAGFAECITVIAQWSGPLTTGDELWEGTRSLGMVDGIVDDGHAEPRLYLAHGESRAIVVERRLPTAVQQMQARCVGEGDPITNVPLTGEPIRDDQLVWLAAAGGRALVSEFAGYQGAAVRHGMRVFETMTKLEPVEHAWRAAHAGDTFENPPSAPADPNAAMDALFAMPVMPGPAPTPAPAPPPAEPPKRDIFSFFEKPAQPKDGPFETVEVLHRLAWAAGLALDDAGDHRSLAISFAELHAAGTWSQGRVEHAELLDAAMLPVTGGLLCAKLFGPIEDYKCLCGKYARMKHRGVVCEKCGVEVIASRVRTERFAHYELVEPITSVRLAGQRIHVLPIAPPGMRKPPEAELDQRYREVIERDIALRKSPAHATRQALTDAVDAVLDLTLRRFVNALVPGTRRTDFSGSARVIVGHRRRVPLAMLTEILRPLLIGVSEQRGYTTTIKSAMKLLRTNREHAAELARAVLHDRVLLFASERTPACVGASVEIGDDPIIELDRDLAARLGVSTGDVVSVHLPVSDDGQAEAKRVTSSAHPADAGSRSWLYDVAMAEDRIARVVEHAAHRSVDPCTWAPAAILIGGYPPSGPAAPPPELGPPPPPPPRPAEPPELNRLVLEIEWSARTKRALESANITTVRELVQRTESDLLKMNAIGRQQLREVKEILANMGLQLGMRF